MQMILKEVQNDIEIFTLEGGPLSVRIAPALGGKIISVYNKTLEKEFLWHNASLPLAVNASGAEYDPVFWGAIDELIPNDLPEKIDGINYPDHGELWTTALQYQLSEKKITVYGKLALSGLFYSKTVSVEEDAPVIWLDYKIRNDTDEVRHFLWKLHAALIIGAGDQLVTPACRAKVVDPEYSRFRSTAEFPWPFIEGKNAAIVPPASGTMDFFYLYDADAGEMQLRSADEAHLFGYSYDSKIFPFQWWFASFGGFLDHYTAILEPCTNMPMSVNDAIKENQSARLLPGEELVTRVRVFAGETKNYIPLHG